MIFYHFYCFLCILIFFLVDDNDKHEHITNASLLLIYSGTTSLRNCWAIRSGRRRWRMILCCNNPRPTWRLKPFRTQCGRPRCVSRTRRRTRRNARFQVPLATHRYRSPMEWGSTAACCWPVVLGSVETMRNCAVVIVVW